MKDNTFVPRIKALRDMEGWYETPISPLFEMYKASKSRVKYSKWLAQNGITDQKQVKKLVEASTPVKFKVSCRYADILRCSRTKHFTSCLAKDGCNSHASTEYLEEIPELGIVYVPDSKGDFRGRFFIILWEHEGAKYITPMRSYGDIPTYTMLDVLAAATGRELVAMHDVHTKVTHFYAFSRLLGNKPFRSISTVDKLRRLEYGSPAPYADFGDYTFD